MSNIIGGTPTGDGDAIIDATSAVLLDHIFTVKLGAKRDNGLDTILGLELAGRVNQSAERLTTLYLMDINGAGKLIADVVELAAEISDEFFDALMNQLEHLDRVRHKDAFGRPR